MAHAHPEMSLLLIEDKLYLSPERGKLLFRHKNIDITHRHAVFDGEVSD